MDQFINPKHVARISEWKKYVLFDWKSYIFIVKWKEVLYGFLTKQINIE